MKVISKEQLERNEVLIKRLEEHIEFVTATKNFSLLGFYNDLLAHLTSIQESAGIEKTGWISTYYRTKLSQNESVSCSLKEQGLEDERKY